MENPVDKAAETIKQGGVILYPTDTIWGLGCDPENKLAVSKIDAIKARAEGKNYILIVDSEKLLNKYVDIIPEVAYDLIDYADKPLTIIYPKANKCIAHLAADDGSIAVRLVKDKTCSAIMQRTKTGIVSTSANISNEPYTFPIPNKLVEQVDFSFEQKEQKENKASQIIKIKENGEFEIIRK